MGCFVQNNTGKPPPCYALAIRERLFQRPSRRLVLSARQQLLIISGSNAAISTRTWTRTHHNKDSEAAPCRHPRQLSHSLSMQPLVQKVFRHGCISQAPAANIHPVNPATWQSAGNQGRAGQGRGVVGERLEMGGDCRDPVLGCRLQATPKLTHIVLDATRSRTSHACSGNLDPGSCEDS